MARQMRHGMGNEPYFGCETTLPNNNKKGDISN